MHRNTQQVGRQRAVNGLVWYAAWGAASQSIRVRDLPVVSTE